MWKTASRIRKSRRNRTNDSRRHTESGPPLTHSSTRSPGVKRSCARTLFVTRSRTLATPGGLRAAVVLRHFLIEADRALEALLHATHPTPCLQGVLESREGRDVLLPHLVHHE